jgi:8-oxo-dGTP diphosphatase
LAAEVPVCCAVIRSGSKVLVARRAAGRHLAHHWEFPGGKVADGETPQDCIVREIREELGVDVRPLGRLPEVVHDYGDTTVRLIPFECEILSGSPEARDHADVRWIDRGGLLDLHWCPADLPIVRAVASP